MSYEVLLSMSAGEIVVFIIVNLLFTVAIYSLPIFVYRYAIRKEPVDKKTGKKITIFYGIAAFILMSIISNRVANGSILLWSGVNYSVLTRVKKGNKGNNPIQSSSDSQNEILSVTMGELSGNGLFQQVEGATAKRIQYCRRCGAKLHEDSRFCSICGNMIEKEEDYDEV